MDHSSRFSVSSAKFEQICALYVFFFFISFVLFVSGARS